MKSEYEQYNPGGYIERSFLNRENKLGVSNHNRKQKNPLFAQRFIDLLWTSSLNTVLSLPLIYLTKLAIVREGYNVQHFHKALFLNIIMLIALICNQVVIILNYRYLVQNQLMKETKFSKFYAYVSTILLILIAIAIEIGIFVGI